MEQRVGRLESSLARLEEQVGGIALTLARLEATLPTKKDLFNYSLTSLGIALALMALVVGGIIGGLSWLKPDPSPAAAPSAPAPQPIIIQLPPTLPAR